MKRTERFGKPPGIKPGMLRSRPITALAPTLYQRFQAWVRSVCARGMHFGRVSRR